MMQNNNNELQDFFDEFEQVDIVRSNMCRELEADLSNVVNGRFIIGHYPNYAIACITNDGKLFAQITPIVSKIRNDYSRYFEISSPFKEKFTLDTIQLVTSFVNECYNEHFEAKIDTDSKFNKAKKKHKELSEERKQEDKVDHPSHYNRNGAMECIDEMILLFGIEETMSFCKLNSWKYRSRAMDKGGLEDMEKSDWYIAKYKELKELL